MSDGSSRGRWGGSRQQELPSMIGQDEVAMFEVSGTFLSSRHSTLEEVVSGHKDIIQALQARVEVSSLGCVVDYG